MRPVTYRLVLQGQRGQARPEQRSPKLGRERGGSRPSARPPWRSWRRGSPVQGAVCLWVLVFRAGRGHNICTGANHHDVTLLLRVFSSEYCLVKLISVFIKFHTINYSV